MRIIIGNGFDIDLELNTTYMKFVESSSWESLYNSNINENGLATYIKAVSVDSWFNMLISRLMNDYSLAEL